MAGPEWVYSVSAKRYRDVATGRFISQNTLVDLRDRYLAGEVAENRGLAERLFSRQISIHDWEREMVTGMARAYTNLYVANRGGRRLMTDKDWNVIRENVGRQYRVYLAGFKASLIAGEYTEGQLEKALARMNMYTSSANLAFNLGKMAAYGIPELPAQPGDMSSECGSNDRCYWHIDEYKTEWHCYWRTSSDNPCSTCESRRSQWNPLIITKE